MGDIQTVFLWKSGTIGKSGNDEAIARVSRTGSPDTLYEYEAGSTTKTRRSTGLTMRITSMI